MKKHPLKLNTMLERYNPFALVDADGALEKFEDENAAYFEVIKRLYEMFPRGFVDVALFMVRQQGITLTQAEYLLKRREYCVLQIFCPYDDERNSKLKTILQKLLEVTDISWSQRAFLNAVYRYDKYLLEKQVNSNPNLNEKPVTL